MGPARARALEESMGTARALEEREKCRENDFLSLKKCCFSGGFRPQSERMVFKQRRDMFFWKVSSSLGAFGAHGHVHVPTFDSILHVSGPKLTF